MNEKILTYKKGFTLIESLVSIAIFALLISVVYQSSVSIIQQTRKYRESTTISGLADQYMEMARNLPYSQIGTLSGNPHGSLADQPNAATTTINNTLYSIYYEVTYIDDPADGTAILGTDPAPNDYKQVKLSIKNNTTGVVTDFLTNISPKGLEGLSSGGALYIKVFNAVGQPVPDASITITNTSVVPNINLNRTSDASGNWVEVGLPISATSYHVVVTKNGYSSDQTYPSTGPNPNPTKPDATISNGQVTQISFSIDQVSNLTFSTVDQTCDPIPSVGLEVKGAKLIGTPSVLKFDNTYISNSSGLAALNNIEWDNYTPSLTGTTYMIYGSSPIQQISMLPNTSQTFTLVLGPKTANSLLVIVKDSSTGNSIKGANVDLQTISPASDTNKLTGGSIWGQQSWNGGAGQSDWDNSTMYYQDDGNIGVQGVPAGVRLASGGGSSYVASGVLTSSGFDTGATSTSYTTLNWQPTSQDASTTLKFQIATNNDDATWNYLGPDGTSNTYYTVPGTTITSTSSGEYVRYKAFLSTTDPNKTPILTSTSINYVSGCFTPGQVFFPSLAGGSNYQVVASMAGYQTQTISNVTVSGYNVLQISLSTN
jgi:prepilin-type N-terminal cleavage/methylation domain-containing protein